MARFWYGGTFADFAVAQGVEAEIYTDDISPSGQFGTTATIPLESAQFDVFIDADLSVETTDLLDESGAAIARVPSETEFDTRGTIVRFQGPDGYEGPLWLSVDGETGFRCEPESGPLYTRLLPIESDVVTIGTDIDAVEASLATLDGRLDVLEAVSPPTFEVFSADDTWTKPAGATRVLVECQGAGGAGGGAAATGADQGAEGAGGGGGGYGAKWFDASALAATVAVVVGTGGAGSAGGAGGNGEDSSFGAHFGAVGGGGGAAMAASAGPTFAAGGEGGTVSDLGTGLPPIVVNGGDGSPGIVVTGPGQPVRQNAGGACQHAGRRFRSVTTSGDGEPGHRGSGGSGGTNVANQGAARAGGAGGDGHVYVTTFF